MAAYPARVLSVCSGVGGLDLALKLAAGDAVRTVCYVEREAPAAAILVARMEEGSLDEGPIWDDLATFDARPWRGKVDGVIGGIPCQPASNAGARLGLDDERWLWPDFWRLVRGVGARWIVVENVRGLLSLDGGFNAILGDLAAAGWTAEWGLFSAEAVSAPHERARIFIVADSGCSGDDPIQQVPLARGGRAAGARVESEAMANAVGERCDGRTCDPGRRSLGRAAVERPSPELADAASSRRNAGRGIPLSRQGQPDAPRGSASLAVGVGQRRAAGRTEREIRDEITAVEWRGLFPPGFDDAAGWRAYLGDGGATPALPQSRIRGGIDGPASRLDRLRALGNGVVPLVGAYAIRTLFARMTARS